jgi:integrase
VVAALERDGLAKVLDQAASRRSLFELVAFTGTRISAALGILWRDVDIEAGILRAKQQLTRLPPLRRLAIEGALLRLSRGPMRSLASPTWPGPGPRRTVGGHRERPRPSPGQ